MFGLLLCQVLCMNMYVLLCLTIFVSVCVHVCVFSGYIRAFLQCIQAEIVFTRICICISVFSSVCHV